jgi:hypothetical protein
MNIKNTSNRNTSCLAPHSKSGGMCDRFMVPAGSTLNVDDELYAKCEKAADALIKAGIFEKVATKKEEVAAKAVEKSKKAK